MNVKSSQFHSFSEYSCPHMEELSIEQLVAQFHFPIGISQICKHKIRLRVVTNTQAGETSNDKNIVKSQWKISELATGAKTLIFVFVKINLKKKIDRNNEKQLKAR